MRHRRRLLIVIILLIVAFITISTLLNKESASLTEQEITVSELMTTNTGEVNLTNNTQNTVGNYDNSLEYAKSFLSDDEKNIYETIKENAINHSIEQFDIRQVSTEQLKKAYISFLNDNPQIFYVSSIKYYANEQNQVSRVKIIFNVTKEQRDIKQQLIDNKTQQILSGVSKSWSDYEKVKYLYDYIIQNTTYQISAPDNQNIYSVLINRHSVCAGYARTLQYLMTKLDMFCMYVTGNTVDNESNIGHAWNLVKMDNEYYYVDATWGDPMFRLKLVNKSYIGYGYFAITTKELELTHVLDKTYPLPDATSHINNYYVKENLLISSKEEVKSVIANALIAGNPQNKIYYSFKFANEEIYNYALNSVLNSENFSSLISQINESTKHKYRNQCLAIYPSPQKLTVDFTLRYILSKDIVDSKKQTINDKLKNKTS